jgi:hypothetical protein
MQKMIAAFVVMLSMIGCKTVDVSLPIPVRISGRVTIEGPSPDFSRTVLIPAQILSDGISEHTEEGEEMVVDLESVVLVVSRNDCAENTVIEDGLVRIGLGVQIDSLASVQDLNLTEVLGDTLRARLHSAGVGTLNTFARNTLAGGNDILVVVVDGTANPPPPPNIDFDIDVVFAFTVVVVREMTSIGP